MSDVKLKTFISSHSSFITVLKVIGNLDAGMETQLSKGLESSLEIGNKFLIVDLSDVDFISSPIIGTLMGIRRRLVETAGDLYIVGLSAENKNKFKLMGAEKIFFCLHDERSAVLKHEWEQEKRKDSLILEIPSRLDFIPCVRSFISRVGGIKDYTKRDSFRLETIIDEIGNNAIEHCDAETNNKIDFEIGISKEKVEINVTDYHDGTITKEDCENIKKIFKDPAKYRDDFKRGRGIELVKMLTESLDVEVEENKTTVKILKMKEV